MNKIKMTNSIFLALYLTFLLSLMNPINSVSISDMESSIKSLNPNLTQKQSSSFNSSKTNSKKTQNKNELEKLNEKNNINNRTNNNINKNINTKNNKKNEKQFEISQCELITEGPICLSNGDRVFLPAAQPKSLIAHWSFDDSKPLDDSGNNNHAVNSVKAGPALGGTGHSAYFSNGDFLEVPHNKQFESAVDFSISFWFYLLTEKKDENNILEVLCPLVQKGSDDLLNRSYSRFPAIFFDRKNKKFKIYAKTNLENVSEGEAFASNARANYKKWLHIALIKKSSIVLFYVNGILDAQMELKGEPILNNGSLFIGNTPAFKDKCKLNFLIDEMRFYNRAIEEDYVQAEASPALGGIEPNFVQLGCFDCGIKEAINSCKEGYKLCSSIEMHTAGYQISRAMGWIKFDTHIWTNAAVEHEKDFEGKKGLALCCVEIK
jgi:hypothetical protein